jgi:hypothetical protein
VDDRGEVMSDQSQKRDASTSEATPAYEKPVVEDIGTSEAPAVTAAGISKDV